MKKLIICIIIILSIIILFITVNSNRYETVGDILEDIEKDYGKIVSFLIVKDNYDETRKRERYGVVGDDTNNFREDVSKLEIEAFNGSNMEILYPVIIHTKTEEGFAQLRLSIFNGGLKFDGKEYNFEDPDDFQEIIDRVIDEYPYE
ncbi:hypothetical protein [Alkalicoccobacillus gibsonii]|uniref:hypothetical protein n=1 Tax=Alkalicoccobacillus gibsonii TaxID=79881 RepID=UPI0019344834|nr:hypothetical protein [Alkalicoccobacillus gibsonii]MBM0066776.1 hypothetical protein [Alkalicoccobacillus gibsonii]